MGPDNGLDSAFRHAVLAIDAGDVPALVSLLALHPDLSSARLVTPGQWLRARVGPALGGFFKDPYLLWFVAEDPVRNGSLPPNIGHVARVIIQHVRASAADTLQEQLDYCLHLVSWSTVARESNVQLDLIDVLLDAGASSGGCPDNAIVNSNFAAAAHLVRRGAPLTLSTALCLDRWDDADRLAKTASPGEKQFALVLAALKGRPDAVRRALQCGADVNARSNDLFPHGTPLHHAASSGSLPSVKVLVEAGASLDAVDTAYNGTPLGWAEYGKHEEIAVYLRMRKRD